eukprot:CAMPEP_0113663510 /NCGR_PEP_ID=MMETSP0038_2-20120614/1185_1 /TAXON_ID=2898 /ORGANISM="Cryptomonas paramecium" /LENGTH=43 /DNA_ID=CAMNT_0000578551 /DNA_START=316 /DNA_END=444 /DNA_ORIENTATION=+ /assembly_acc=CAM_ASM_000170
MRKEGASMVVVSIRISSDIPDNEELRCNEEEEDWIDLTAFVNE